MSGRADTTELFRQAHKSELGEVRELVAQFHETGGTH